MKNIFHYFEVFKYVKIKYVRKFFIGRTNKKKQMFLNSDGLGVPSPKSLGFGFWKYSGEIEF